MGEQSVCPHENFHCTNIVHKLVGENAVWKLMVRVKCSDCGHEFRHMGLPIGNMGGMAMTSWDGKEATIRIAP